MSLLRTPEERFTDLPDYPFEPKYVEHNGARMHYVDEGEGEVILCLHGEPSWSYLYRKFYPVLQPNFKVVSPDLLGFGKSDKYPKQSDYNYQMHLQSLISFIDQLELNIITLVCQDWGGLLGLGVVGVMPERFARLVIMNTTLPTPTEKGNIPLPFKIWQAYAKYHPNLPVGGILKKGTYQPMSDAVKAAYDAPFPSNKYKAGAKVFPALVTTQPGMAGIEEMSQAKEVLKKWQKPALVMFSDKDPIMKGRDKWFRSNIPTANDQPFIIIKDAGHFLQEDKGEEIAQHIKQFMERTPTK